jgi:phosphodiesterase/alkaline phosphatase D-like protein
LWPILKLVLAVGRRLQQGEVTASSGSDFTVKVVVTDLQPATRYYYWFTAGECSCALLLPPG